MCEYLSCNFAHLFAFFCEVTRSQAVARIADRTASLDSSNYNGCVIRPSILWVYQRNLEETKTNNIASSSVQVEDPWRQ